MRLGGQTYTGEISSVEDGDPSLTLIGIVLGEIGTDHKLRVSSSAT